MNEWVNKACCCCYTCANHGINEWINEPTDEQVKEQIKSLNNEEPTIPDKTVETLALISQWVYFRLPSPLLSMLFPAFSYSKSSYGNKSNNIEWGGGGGEERNYLAS